MKSKNKLAKYRLFISSLTAMYFLCAVVMIGLYIRINEMSCPINYNTSIICISIFNIGDIFNDRHQPLEDALDKLEDYYYENTDKVKQALTGEEVSLDGLMDSQGYTDLGQFEITETSAYTMFSLGFSYKPGNVGCEYQYYTNYPAEKSIKTNVVIRERQIDEKTFITCAYNWP